MSVALSSFGGVVAEAVAIRGTAIREPAGGLGDNVFPPSHSVDERDRVRSFLPEMVGVNTRAAAKTSSKIDAILGTRRRA